VIATGTPIFPASNCSVLPSCGGMAGTRAETAHTPFDGDTIFVLTTAKSVAGDRARRVDADRKRRRRLPHRAMREAFMRRRPWERSRVTATFFDNCLCREKFGPAGHDPALSSGTCFAVLEIRLSSPTVCTHSQMAGCFS